MKTYASDKHRNTCGERSSAVSKDRRGRIRISTFRSFAHRRCFDVFLVLAVVGSWMLPAALFAQDNHGAPSTSEAVEEEVHEDALNALAPTDGAATVVGSPAEPREDETPVRDPRSYGLWVIMPAVVAILLAIFTRQVVPALVMGVLVGAYMMVPCVASDDEFAESHVLIPGGRLATERYTIGAIHEPPGANFAHIKIMIFTLVIGFMVGAIFGLLTTVGGELVAGSERGGLGRQLKFFSSLIILDGFWATIVVIAALGVTIYVVFFLIGKKWASWQT